MMKLISRTEDGFYHLPTFIDAHVHVESTHLALPVIPALKLTDFGLFAC